MERIGIRGLLTLYERPAEWSTEEMCALWCPVTDARGRLLRPARVREEERAHLIRQRGENLFTNDGIAQWMTDLSVANQSQMQPITQILSVGNGSITGVFRSDTSVAGDGFTSGARKAPVSYSQVGLQTTVIADYSGSDGVGTWTNIGFYGGGSATTSTGTGTLMTHALFPFVKASGHAYVVSYVFVLTN